MIITMNHHFVRNLLMKPVPWNHRFLQRYISCFEFHRNPIDNFKFHHQIRLKSDKPTLSSLVVPVEVKISNNPDDVNIGAEITGSKLDKKEIVKIINQILSRENFKRLAAENGIDHTLFQQCFQSFRSFYLKSKILPTELHIKLYDILHGNGNVDDLFPDFLKHAKQVFPHLECLEELKKISDLTSPVNWYPEARSLNRKIIFHGGPTNSGKTYHALKRFYEAESGIYCAPLKLLAVEVTNKTNAVGTKCDLVTGEERFFANEDGTPASHVSCTVEMACTSTPREVAIIDEIQMIRDPQRGWAWTRALLGIPAKEIHLCGEEASLDIIKEILSAIPEEVEVNRYKRLTPLELEKKPLASLENVKKGDCIVCFSKKDIFNVSLELEKLGHDVAVIYGSLPPGTKVAQTKKFNDPKDPCNILVATDAIGMGLNLSINRIIFLTLKKPIEKEKGGVEMEVIPTSTALQIAGRAGRFNTEYSTGYVTCFNQADLTLLKNIMSHPVEPIGAAGLHPTMEQIELFAYHLPKATFSNLFDIFLSICKMDTSCYFMCNVDNIKYLADLIQHVPLSLRVRYVFCHAPINLKVPFICTMFLKFARQFSNNSPLTVDWILNAMDWPFKLPRNIAELVHLEAAFDVLDLYLWLGYRFSDMFPDSKMISEMQKELDILIHKGVKNFTSLLKLESQVVRKENSGASTETKINTVEESDERKEETVSKEVTEKVKNVKFSSAKQKQETIEDVPIDFTGKLKTAKFSPGSMTDQLIKSGIVSTKVLKKLYKEWASSGLIEGDSNKRKTLKNSISRRKKH